MDDLLVRLASSAEEIDGAQALRHRVVYEEMNGRPSITVKWELRDFDVFDSMADHLLVLEPTRIQGAAGVVVTACLLRGRAARSIPPSLLAAPFSVPTDFNIDPLLKWPEEIVELSRTCIHPDHRSHHTTCQVWVGIAAYSHAYNIGVVFGTTGVPATQPLVHLSLLAYLHDIRLAAPALRPEAVPDGFVNMINIPAAAVDHEMAWKESHLSSKISFAWRSGRLLCRRQQRFRASGCMRGDPHRRNP